MHYQATFESLSTHAVPAWFEDAKLGIFAHWGPYSVPAWAPAREVDFTSPDWFAENAYAEWYQNSLAIAGNSTNAHHAATYGADYAYERFGATLRENARGWDPAPWADLFAAAGARYVVPGSKHHDGFLMWPSRTPNPHRDRWQMERDVLGDLAGAVRSRGMRFGLYYSGGLDWTFGGLPIDSVPAMLAAIRQEEAYARYADTHWRELIERYQPSVLWNDIGYPSLANSPQLFADYYNAIPDGVINDRFDPLGAWSGTAHHDFTTPEYGRASDIKTKKWEACRGIGNSFGFNRQEAEAQYVTSRELVHSLADIVSKNGNLLLNVGPTASGEIPWPQAERLLALGHWLRVNGEAIYATRPWVRAEARTAEGLDVRFTATAEALYAIVFDPGDAPAVTLPGLRAEAGAVARQLGRSGETPWTTAGDGMRIELPAGPQTAPAIAFKIAPKPAAEPDP